MEQDQLALFNTKKYQGVLPQTVNLKPPTGEDTVLKTIPAYYAYLRSGGYSKYTPDDFTGDVRRFGVPAVLEQKTTILWKYLYLLASLKDSPGLGGVYETYHRGGEENPVHG